MILYKLNSRIDDVSNRLRRRVSLKEIEEATGVSSTVLSYMRTKYGYVTTTRQIDALCKYFECQPGDLLQWVPDDVEEGLAGA
jgi:putative transcriptional regulator